MAAEYYNEVRDFSRLSDSVHKTEIAISRLENPQGLTDEMVIMYQKYLFDKAPKIAHSFIDLNRKALLPLLVKYRVIKKSNILQLTDYARENKKLDILSYLMDVGNQLRNNSKNLGTVKKHTAGKPLPRSQTDCSTAQPGSIIWLGTPLMPWQVLENKDGRLLLLSVYVLDCLPFEDFYDPFYYTMSYDRTIWRYSSIRRRTNGEILSAILSPQEKEKIVPVYIADDDSLSFEPLQGIKPDKLFFLSKREAERYLKTETDRLAPVTGYAVRSNLYHLFEDYAYWWLRSPGEHEVEKMFVLDGEITSKNSLVGGDHFNYLGIRPAMYYKI